MANLQPGTPLQYRKKTLQAKLGAVAPGALTDPIQTIGLDIIPIEAETADVPQDRATLGHVPQVSLSVRTRMRFGVALAGSDTAATKTKWEDLTKACGLDTGAQAADGAAAAWADGSADALYDLVANGGTTWECIEARAANAGNAPTVANSGGDHFREYFPLPAGRKITPSASIDASSLLYLQGNLDGNQHRAKGSRGNVTMTVEAGSLPQIDFDFVGEFAKPTAVAIPTLDFDGWYQALPVSETNTPIARFGPLEVVLNRFQFDLGNDIQYLSDPNRTEGLIANRLPGGSVRFEMWNVSGATADYATNLWAAIEAQTTDRLRLRHGTAAGQRIEFYGPNVQLTEPTVVEAQGRYMIEASFRVLEDTDDDFVIRTF